MAAAPIEAAASRVDRLIADRGNDPNDDIEEEPGIVLYTVVDQHLAGTIDSRCAAMGLPCVSVLEPVLSVFQSYLGAPAGPIFSAIATQGFKMTIPCT